jgi:hypothetical protein
MVIGVLLQRNQGVVSRGAKNGSKQHARKSRKRADRQNHAGFNRHQQAARGASALEKFTLERGAAAKLKSASN